MHLGIASWTPVPKWMPLILVNVLRSWTLYSGRRANILAMSRGVQAFLHSYSCPLALDLLWKYAGNAILAGGCERRVEAGKN